jgi:1,4-dihydroxy-2-naphthoate octaprenyltransferase
MAPESRIAVWIQAARPRTLPASVVPVAVGTALAAHIDAGSARHPSWLPFLGCLVGALLIQIGTNFANDAFDHLKGADTAARVGPRRAVAAGLITPRAMLLATLLVLGLALAVGLYLTTIAGWPILVLGLISILCAVAYTGGPFPLAYHGLGDLFVYLFFGLVAVIGTVDVQTMAINPSLTPWPHFVQLAGQGWLLALASGVGLQCTAIIAVNNLRDRDTDRLAGKRTLAVRLGGRLARWYYGALHLGAVASYAVFAVAVVAMSHGNPYWSWLPVLVAAAGGALLTWQVARRDGPALNRCLARSASLELLTGVLLVVTLSI